jgi:predicted O-methyltransferase YrrM
MNKVFISLRYTFGTLIHLLYNLIQYPFSKIARHRLSTAYSALEFNFYGQSYVDISELLNNNNLELLLAPVKSNEHNTSAFELLAITALVKDKNCNTIFEIGTYDGRTTRAMALNLSTSSGKIYTLNLPPENSSAVLQTGIVDLQLATKVISGDRFLNTPQEKNIEQVWGDSAIFDFSPYYQKVDLVFIDGAHSKAYVANDTAQALKMIKPSGGWVIWHDAPYFGVVKFLKSWAPKQTGPVYFIKGTSLAVAFVKEQKLAIPEMTV